MTDPPRRPAGNGDDVGMEADRGSPPGAPRWVQVVVLVALVVALLVVVLLLVGGGGGGHGPQQHAAAGADAGLPPTTVTLSLR